MADERVTSTYRASPIKANSIAAHVVSLSIAAVLLFLCFPPIGWGILAHVALVPLALVSVRSQRPGRLVLCAWLVFTVWWGVMLMWIHPVTPGGYILMGAVLAVYPALACLLIRALHRRIGTGLVLIVPLVWVVIEFLRDHLILGGFGWFTLAQAISPYDPSHRVPYLLQAADLIGPSGVSLVLAMTSGWLCDLLIRPWVHRDTTGRKRVGRTIRYSTAIWLITLTAGIGYGVWRGGQSFTGSQVGEARIAAVQSNSPQSHRNRPTAESLEREWGRQVDLTLEAATTPPRPDLVVWPETFVPAALNPEAVGHYRTTESGWFGSDVYHTQLGAITKSLEVSLVTGGPAQFDWQTFTTDSGAAYEMPTRNYNSVYQYTPAGTQTLTRYDKQHLVPFGEFIPWIRSSETLKQWFIDYLSPYDFDYTLHRGAGPVLFELATRDGPTLRFGTPICFEDTVSRVCRRMVYDDGEKRADLLVNVTNDGWFEGTREPVLHLQASVLRCVELRVPMVRSVNTGVSGFIDSTGRVGPLVERDAQRTSVDGWVAHNVRTDPRETLYGWWGAWPMWCASTLLFVLTVFALTTRRRKAR